MNNNDKEVSIYIAAYTIQYINIRFFNLNHLYLYNHKKTFYFNVTVSI